MLCRTERKQLLLFLTMLLSTAVVTASEHQNLIRIARSVSYFPEGSTMGLFLALSIPLDDPDHSISISYFFEATYNLPDNSSVLLHGGQKSSENRKRRSIDRTTVYNVIQNKFISAGLPGHECLLRSICEAAEHPLHHNGVLGDLLHVIFTPSSSKLEEGLPDSIRQAELAGRYARGDNGSINGQDCSVYRTGCPLGLFDLIAVLQ